MNLPLREPRRLTRGGVVLGAFLLLAVQSADAQRVRIDFDAYHGYEGTVDYIQDVARAYPDITELLEIGQSNMGRPVYVLVITNRSTGTTIDQHVELRNVRGEGVDNVTPMKPYHGKPGVWIDGGTHGNEYTGTEVTLYIIDQLVTGYGSDDEITQLIDGNTFYICPIVNPDGVYNSVEGGISQRQNSAMVDDDEDGAINEDGPDDLNGDGHITMFRYPDPEGRYVMDSVDSRHMVRLGQDEETDKERYSVVREDRDNDDDGERGEDPERHIDVNRNFPEGWFRDDLTYGGRGAYPASSPEARNILEFFTNHTNILAVQSFHTSGGFTYRPFARWPDDSLHAKDLAIYDRVMGKKYLELLGDSIPEAWQEADPDEEAAAPPAAARRARAGQAGQGRAAPTSGGRGYELPRSWRHPYNDSQGRPYGFGIFIDWAYAQFGTYSMTTELWNWQRDTRGLPGFDGEDDRNAWYRAMLQYQDTELDGELFAEWDSYNHPELGQGEVGGWIAPFSGGNALPGESLRHVAETHWQFELFKAGLLPKLAITDATAEVLYSASGTTDAQAVSDGSTVTIRPGQSMGQYRVVKVTATVENSGALATHVARGARLAGNRQDAIWLIGDRDRIKFLQGSAWQRLGVIEGTMEIPGYDPSAQPTPRQQGQPQFMGMGMGAAPQTTDQTGNTREVTWLIAVEGNTPLKIVLTSQKGGTHVRDLSIR
jgi:hypothetical protein